MGTKVRPGPSPWAGPPSKKAGWLQRPLLQKSYIHVGILLQQPYFFFSGNGLIIACVK